ncbi:Ig-like domain-containing protein [Neptunomonas japonica]|uniref:Ig-like domain-containing protein n=1 Tax=Neptunomonas japonica TaxID=417574 RepID=UPI000418FD24|nr:Ig-like domain-containing protein [Neptunomonas japonica]
MDITDLEPWPLEQLDYPLKRGYSYAVRDNREMSSMYSGPGISRLISRFTITDYQASLLFSKGEELYFRWWIANKLNHGNDYFAMPLLTGAGINTVAAMFSKKGIGASVLDGNRYRISIKLTSFALPAELLTEAEALSLLSSEVVAVNSAPVASNISKSVDQDGSVVIAIVATDYDGSIDYTATAITAGPNHGTVSVHPVTGAATYIPTTNYYGPDEFRYTVADNNGAVSNEGIVLIAVNELGAPVYDVVGVVGETLIGGIEIDAVGVVGETIIGGIEIDAVGVVGETIYGGMSPPPLPESFEFYPDRDGSGVVTADSLQSLPVRSESSLAMHKIVGLDPVAQIDAAITATGFNLATQTFGNSGSSSRNTFTAYAGQVYDPVSKIAYRAWPGGHAESSLNHVDKFDVNKLEYGLVAAPSNPDAPGLEWSQPYRDVGKARPGDPFNGVPADSGSFTPYVSGATETIDGFTQYTREYYLPDGHPTSSHHYAGTLFHDNKLITVRNVHSMYDIDADLFTVSDWSDEDGYLRPDINHFMFGYNGAFYGVMNKKYDSYGFYKVPDPTQPVAVHMPGAPSGVYFNAEHLLVQLDELRICAINSTHKFAIFNMSTETWGPAIDMSGDLPSYDSVQELQVGISIPEWGAAGKVLRQFTYSSMRGDWYLLDLDTGVQTAVTFGGYDASAPWLTSNKAFRVSVGGIEAILYVNVTPEGLSEVYIMRIA